MLAQIGIVAPTRIEFDTIFSHCSVLFSLLLVAGSALLATVYLYAVHHCSTIRLVPKPPKIWWLWDHVACFVGSSRPIDVDHHRWSWLLSREDCGRTCRRWLDLVPHAEALCYHHCGCTLVFSKKYGWLLMSTDWVFVGVSWFFLFAETGRILYFFLVWGGEGVYLKRFGPVF